MGKVLVLTVGGSPGPLITSINTLKPDLVLFVCSEDVGTTKGSYTMLPTILSGTGEIKYEILKVRPDDPENCISTILNKIEEIKRSEPGAEIFVDYTGGTKTMSVSLFWVATHLNLGIYLTTGIRRDLVAIKEGETTRRIHLSFPYYEELLSVVDSLLANYHYTSAEENLRSALANYHFSPEIQEELQRKLEIIDAFRLWDAYDSLNAIVKVKPYKKAFWNDYLSFWDRVAADRMKLEEDFAKEVEERQMPIYSKDQPTQYAIVQDLVLNAERCAVRERYDDATARLYRAMEALAQLRLFTEHGIKTWDVEIERLPGELRGKYEEKRREGKIKIGLIEDYELLWELKDEVGNLFKAREDDLREALRRRNQSIFAHGFKSISKLEYDSIIKARIEGFIKDCLKGILKGRYQEPKQLPKSLEDIDSLLTSAGL
jgi:CRISPR-associated protein (TIGR02710 family)